MTKDPGKSHALKPSGAMAKMSEAFATPDGIAATVRQVGTIIGVLLISLDIVPDVDGSGVGDGADIQTIIGAVLVLVSVGSGILSAVRNFRRKQVLEAVQSINPGTVESAVQLVAAAKKAKATK